MQENSLCCLNVFNRVFIIISILEGAVLVDYHPPSLSSFHCGKWKDKLQVTLSQSQSPVAHALC